MFLSELQNKDIISVKTGINLGRIVDVEVNNEGKIIGFIAEPKKIFKKVLKNSEINFTYNDIAKIGTDVILVNKWYLWYIISMKKKSLIIGLFILIIDQLIKIIIDQTFYIGKIISIIPNFFYVTKVYNTGAAWSMFEGYRFILIGISLIALAFLVFYEKEFKNNFRNIIAFSLIYGGLLGNLVDRLIYGYVIDYFKILLGSYDFPIFNLADMAIVSGFILLIYAIIRGEDKNDSKSRAKWRR